MMTKSEEVLFLKLAEGMTEKLTKNPEYYTREELKIFILGLQEKFGLTKDKLTCPKCGRGNAPHAISCGCVPLPPLIATC